MSSTTFKPLGPLRKFEHVRVQLALIRETLRIQRSSSAPKLLKYLNWIEHSFYLCLERRVNDERLSKANEAFSEVFYL